ncbi:MAG: DedA family protein [Candidatus Woesearchaeota archaeon]
MNYIDIILHIDKYLDLIIQQYGALTYGLLFIIIFLETGLVATPFLPGDSLLFAAGTFASRGAFSLWLLVAILALASVLGDTANYWIGCYLGPKVFTQKKGLFFKKEYLVKTRIFYEKYGAKTIVLARFIPIIRTFAPFVAGIGKMYYPKFLLYNVIGGIAWVLFFVLGGYWFGTIEFVKKNFSLVIIAIITISFIPLIWELISHHWHAKKYEQ